MRRSRRVRTPLSAWEHGRMAAYLSETMLALRMEKRAKAFGLAQLEKIVEWPDGEVRQWVEGFAYGKLVAMTWRGWLEAVK